MRGAMQSLMTAATTDHEAVTQTARQMGYTGEAGQIHSLHQLTAAMPDIVDMVAHNVSQNTVSHCIVNNRYLLFTMVFTIKFTYK